MKENYKRDLDYHQISRKFALNFSKKKFNGLRTYIKHSKEQLDHAISVSKQVEFIVLYAHEAFL